MKTIKYYRMPENDSNTFEDYFEVPELAHYTYVLTWIIPLLCAMAIFGNTLIVIIMHRPKNKHLASSTFFTALAVSDTLLVCQVRRTIVFNYILHYDTFAYPKLYMISLLDTLSVDA